MKIRLESINAHESELRGIPEKDRIDKIKKLHEEYKLSPEDESFEGAERFVTSRRTEND